jgi:HTH-type transcriptional regulator, sugar sensing transcriptional regulator
MHDLKRKLNILGLKEKEIDAYLAILILGKGSITEISRKTNIKRTTVYEYIENLLNKGLIYKTANKKRTFYCAEEPKKITRILDQEKKEIERKKDKFEKIIPELESLFSASFKKPGVSFYEGRNGIKKVYQQILNTHKNIYSIFSPEKFFKLFSPEENYNLLMMLYNNGGILYSLVGNANDHTKELSNEHYKKFIKSKPLPKEFKYETDLLIVDDTIALISFKNMIGIIIKDKAIAQLQKSFFDLIWKSIK